MSSLFTKIIGGEIPANFVHQDEHWVVFMDIYPTAPGHILLVPRHETQYIADLPDECAADLGRMIGLATSCVKKASQAPSVSILLRDGPEAGQEIPHVHVHIIPRHEQVQAHAFSSSSGYESQEAMEAMHEQLTAAWPS